MLQATIKASKAVIIAVGEADNLLNARQIHTISGSGGPALRKSTFEWKVADKYHKLCNFKKR